MTTTNRRNGARPKPNGLPLAKLTYQLAAWTAERRKDGWYVAPSVPSHSGGPGRWSGPFQDIENACLAIARGLCTELADRHTRHIEANGLQTGDPLFGLKPTTRLVTGRRNKTAESLA